MISNVLKSGKRGLSSCGWNTYLLWNTNIRKKQSTVTGLSLYQILPVSVCWDRRLIPIVSHFDSSDNLDHLLLTMY